MSDIYEVGTAANHYISQLYHEAMRNNLDIECILKKLELKADMFDKPDCRVSTEKLSAMQNFIWQELQDETMGLATYPVPAGSYFMMGRVTINQPTLHKALELAAKFYGLVTKAFKVSLSIDNDCAFLSLDFAAKICFLTMVIPSLFVCVGP